MATMRDALLRVRLSCRGALFVLRRVATREDGHYGMYRESTEQDNSTALQIVRMRIRSFMLGSGRMRNIAN